MREAEIGARAPSARTVLEDLVAGALLATMRGIQPDLAPEAGARGRSYPDARNAPDGRGHPDPTNIAAILVRCTVETVAPSQSDVNRRRPVAHRIYPPGDRLTRDARQTGRCSLGPIGRIARGRTISLNRRRRTDQADPEFSDTRSVVLLVAWRSARRITRLANPRSGRYATAVTE